MFNLYKIAKELDEISKKNDEDIFKQKLRKLYQDRLYTFIRNTNFLALEKELREREYVFQPWMLPKSLDIIGLKKQLRKEINFNMEFFNDTNSNIGIPPLKQEWYIKKHIKGNMVGAGNAPIDIVKDDLGIDVGGLTFSGNMTNEKSICQNFQGCGKNLDLYFKNKDYKTITTLFNKTYYDKLIKANDVYSVKKLRYLFFFFTKKNIYLINFKINLSNFYKLVENNKVVGQSIFIDNYIDAQYGNVKLYKAKKRMELRLTKNILNSEYCVKLY